jgi:hypothetical protein
MDEFMEGAIVIMIVVGGVFISLSFGFSMGRDTVIEHCAKYGKYEQSKDVAITCAPVR